MENLSLWSSCYRIMHTANQLCVYGAVTNWCETLGRTESEKVLRIRNMNTEEISSLVKIPRAPPALGNRMHQKLWSFESLSAKSQLKHLHERARFLSSSGEDLVLSDSFWCWWWMREPHTNVQRTHSSSWTSWISGVSQRSMRMPKLDQSWMHIYQNYEVFHGIEVQFQSLSQPNCSSWIFDMQRTWEICGGVTLLR